MRAERPGHGLPVCSGGHAPLVPVHEPAGTSRAQCDRAARAAPGAQRWRVRREDRERRDVPPQRHTRPVVEVRARARRPQPLVPRARWGCVARALTEPQ